MINNLYKKISVAMIIVLCTTLFGNSIMTKDVSAKTVKLSVKSKTITVGKSFNVTVKNAKTKIKVTLSKKKIVKVKKTKKNKYKVTGLKAGTVTITFKVGKKKYKCKVKVKKKQNVTPAPTEKPTEPITQKPEETTHIHHYTNEIEVKEPECGTAGYIIYQCECGMTRKETLTPTVEHQLSTWIIDKMPTFTEAGSKHKECILCHSVVESETIPMLPNEPLETGGDKTDENDEQIDVGDAFH